MWINEAQIELMAMASRYSTAAKWEYVRGPPASLHLLYFQGDGRSANAGLSNLTHSDLILL